MHIIPLVKGVMRLVNWWSSSCTRKCEHYRWFGCLLLCIMGRVTKTERKRGEQKCMWEGKRDAKGTEETTNEEMREEMERYTQWGERLKMGKWDKVEITNFSYTLDYILQH